MGWIRALMLVAALLGALAAAAFASAPPAGAVTPIEVVSKLTVKRPPHIREPVHLKLSAPVLPEGGYYYGVLVLRPHGRYTSRETPGCAVSSDMQRAAYGYPNARGAVSLALAPATSKAHHWCPGGRYEGAVYAVPHAPPCEGKYPCRSEPYEPPSPCWDTGGGHVVCGVVVRRVWSYPEPLPTPLARGTKVVARFTVTFTAH